MDPKNEGIMSKLNVVDMESFKELKEKKKSLLSFEGYLKGLSNSQLEVEVNHLMDRSEETGTEFFSRSQMVLKEITNRAHPAVKSKIEELGKH